MSGSNRRPDQPGDAGRGGPGERGAGGAQRPAERVMHDAPAARPVYRDGGQRDRPGPNEIPDAYPFELSEVALGGADAVPKTTYGSPRGTEPNGLAEPPEIAQRKGHGTVTARVDSGGGFGPVAWITAALAVVAAVVYAAGVFG